MMRVEGVNQLWSDLPSLSITCTRDSSGNADIGIIFP